MRAILPLILLLLITSCSFVSDDGSEREAEERPEFILENVEYTLGQSGESPIFIKSSRMTFYSRDNRAITETFSFEQRDGGEVKVSGQAGYGDINTNTKVMDLKGGVSIHDLTNDMLIEAEELTFDSENSEIYASSDVYVKTSDGEFRGSGFSGDLRMDTYSFDIIKEGVFNL